MLRKLFACFCGLCVLFLASCKNENDITTLSKNEVYFFYQEACQHCHHAADYIHANYPNLAVKSLDIKMPGNMRLFEEAVRTYKIGSVAGTPLICFGKNYIMGWGDDDPKRFDTYVADYNK